MEKTGTYATHPAAFIDQPVATPHQSRQNIGSELPIFHRDSFPPGEAEGQLRKLDSFNEQLSYAGFRAADSRPYRWFLLNEVNDFGR